VSVYSIEMSVGTRVLTRTRRNNVAYNMGKELKAAPKINKASTRIEGTYTEVVRYVPYLVQIV
jgi:hypothetical protein